MRFLSTAGDLVIWACVILAPLLVLHAALRKLRARRAPSSAHPAARFRVPRVTAMSDDEIWARLMAAVDGHGDDCGGDAR